MGRQLSLIGAIKGHIKAMGLIRGGGANKALKASRLRSREGPRAQLAIAPIGKIPILGFRLY